MESVGLSVQQLSDRADISHIWQLGIRATLLVVEHFCSIPSLTDPTDYLGRSKYHVHHELALSCGGNRDVGGSLASPEIPREKPRHYRTRWGIIYGFPSCIPPVFISPISQPF